MLTPCFILSAALSFAPVPPLSVAPSCALHPGKLLGSSHAYDHMKSIDVATCCNKCNKDKRCAAFNWEPRDHGTCYLQHDSTHARPSPHNGTVSGVSQNPPSPGPSPGPKPPSPGPNPPVSAAQVTISGQVYWHTDPLFKSWNIDASPNRGWEVRNLSQPKLHLMAAASLPGYLRFGGSGNDGLTYGVGDIAKCAADDHHCFNETHFHDFMAFSKASGAKLIFGLNIDPRDAHTGNWDPTQARALMVYGRAHYGDEAFFGFELGNEQNGRYSPAQSVADFQILNDLINSIWGDVHPTSNRPKLIGPDPHGFHDSPMGDADKKKLQYLSDFAVAARGAKLSMFALTHHEYVEVSELLTHPPKASVLDMVGGIAASVNATLRGAASVPTTTLIFAGETGPHNGGSPGVVSDKSMRWANFADTFWYIDAMASKAKNGYSAFCRQDFVGIDYGMIDPETNAPLPDFYAGILWSTLMGTGVIRAQVTAGNGTVRAYAHCTPDAANSGSSSNGNLTVVLLNLASSDTNATHISLAGVHGCTDSHCARTEWRLSGPHGTNSPAMALNDNTITLNADGSVPPLPGKEVVGTTALELPGATIAFLRFEGAGKILGC